MAKTKRGKKFVPEKEYAYTRDGKRIKVPAYMRWTPD